MTPGPSTTESSLRVLVLAPTGRDAEVIVQTLKRADMVADACSSMGELCRRIASGAGAALVTGEALASSGQHALEQTVRAQPEWSDFPLIVMTTKHHELGPGWAFARRSVVSYTMILERPVHAETLVSAVRSALRSRGRQYQVRDELAGRRRAEAALQESDRRKDEFLAMLGHELRNPLAAIRTATELVKAATGEQPRLQRAHGVLERQSKHMAQLIDGLLEVSRITRGKIHLNRGLLDIQDVLEGVLHDRTNQLAARGLELRRDFPPEPLWALADQVRLAQIFDNLLGNAIKFTPAPGTVTVTLGRNDGAAVVRVRDTGIGIRPELLSRIFEPFQQEAQDSARAAGGLGLGLAVAKGLVDLHGGTIEPHSAGPGTGAEFIVRLPLTEAPPRVQAAIPRAAVSTRRVLLVEDNADAATVLADVLEIGGHQVETVSTGAEALEALRQREVDVVLCDIGLPGMNGYQVARAIRADASLRGTRLVALTGYGQPEDRQRSREAGFDEHLTKPVELSAIQEVLARLAPEKG